MSEIDVSQQAAANFVVIQPGDEYLVGWAVATSLDYRWAVWGNAPFEAEVRGVRLLGPIPNPFNSGWTAASSPFQGMNCWGLGNTEGIISHYVVVRSGTPDTHIGFSSKFTGGGGIVRPL